MYVYYTIHCMCLDTKAICPPLLYKIESIYQVNMALRSGHLSGVWVNAVSQIAATNVRAIDTIQIGQIWFVWIVHLFVASCYLRWSFCWLFEALRTVEWVGEEMWLIIHGPGPVHMLSERTTNQSTQTVQIANSGHHGSTICAAPLWNSHKLTYILSKSCQKKP